MGCTQCKAGGSGSSFASSKSTLSSHGTSSTGQIPSSTKLETMEATLQNLILSYTSMENYIQQQRIRSYQSLLAIVVKGSDMEDLCLNADEVATMESLQKDLNCFKRFRKLNRYLYETVTCRFMKNLRGCMLQIVNIDEINAKSLDELNSFRLTAEGEKMITKSFEKRVQALNDLISRVKVYLDGINSKLTSLLTESMNQTEQTTGNNFYTIELNSMNTKRLSAYQLPPTSPDSATQKRTTL